jgi:hypothetical protein
MINNSYPLAITTSDVQDAICANLIILFGITLSLYVCQIAYNISLHPYNNIARPSLASFGKLWVNTRQLGDSRRDDILELYRQIGPVVRVTADKVSFVDRRPGDAV